MSPKNFPKCIKKYLIFCQYKPNLNQNLPTCTNFDQIFNQALSNFYNDHVNHPNSSQRYILDSNF